MAAGDLDPSFAGDGRKTIGFGGTDAARAVLVQPDGRIVLAGGGGPGRFCAVRLRPDGTIDPAFGKRTVGFGGGIAGAFGAALQPDGKLVMVGDSDLDVAVARLNPNGTLDRTFSGDGRKIFSWGAISRATAVLVLPDGRLVVGGLSGPEGGDIKVARLLPGGALDGTFGDGGIVTIDFGGDDSGLALALQPNGRILVVGRSTANGMVIARLRPDGAFDPAFGGTGRRSLGTGSANAVLVRPDRKIIVAGNMTSDTMAVTRIRADSTPEMTTFIDVGELADSAADAALAPGGKVVAAGSRQDGGDLAVVRLDAAGEPDATFGSAGRVSVDFGAAAFGFAVAVQADGRIVVAGQRTGNDDFAVARLLG